MQLQLDGFLKEIIACSDLCKLPEQSFVNSISRFNNNGTYEPDFLPP